MTTKSIIKYASIDDEPVKDISNKKLSSRKLIETKLIDRREKLLTKNRRCQSLDRLDDNSGDSRDDRRHRRQYMHLVSIGELIRDTNPKKINTIESL